MVDPISFGFKYNNRIKNIGLILNNIGLSKTEKYYHQYYDCGNKSKSLYSENDFESYTYALFNFDGEIFDQEMIN